jgi:hypothetical protein
VWGHGGNHVELEGSFDNWTQRYTMQRSGKDFTLVKLLPPGVYQVGGPAAAFCAAWACGGNSCLGAAGGCLACQARVSLPRPAGLLLLLLLLLLPP